MLMVAATETFSAWLAQGRVPQGRLTPEQRGLLQAAFRFRQQQGTDSYARRVLGYFLAQGRAPRPGGADPGLPGNRPGPQEGPLASAVYDQPGRGRRGVGAVP